MNEAGDKLVTIGGSEDATSSKSAACKNLNSVSRAKNARTNRARKAGPIATVKFGSAILAVGAFSGIRMAELNRLDWSAIDLERGIIELRADQAKTASRRLIPITDNLRAWIEPLPRKGKLVRHAGMHREVTSLARALKMEWPRNVLRHSFIS